MTPRGRVPLNASMFHRLSGELRAVRSSSAVLPKSKPCSSVPAEARFHTGITVDDRYTKSDGDIACFDPTKESLYEPVKLAFFAGFEPGALSWCNR